MPTCLICSGEAVHKMTMPVDAKTFKPTPHGIIYECKVCGFGFVHPRPARTEGFYELDAYYTQGASHFVQKAESALLTRLRTHLAWRADKGSNLVDVITREMPAGRILDIGCGGGVLLQELASKGFEAIGVERDVAALSRKSLSVLEGTAEHLPPLDPASFDGVVFSHVLEHLIDPLAAVRSAAVLLKPGAKMFFEVPNNDALIAKQSRLSWEHLDTPRHINFFGEQSLRRLAEQGGLNVQCTYFAGYCRYFSESYIATEQRIHDRLAAVGATESTRNTSWRSWLLLTKTALAAARQKYDSVGLVTTSR